MMQYSLFDVEFEYNWTFLVIWWIDRSKMID